VTRVPSATGRLCALLVACAAAGCAAGVQPARTVPASRLRLAASVRTPAGNQAAARQDASSLLAAVALPPGAVRSPAEPGGDGGLLAHPFTGPPATPNAIDDPSWWVDPAPLRAVVRYIEHHPPAGLVPAMSGALSRHGQTLTTGIGFEWPTVPGVLGMRSLVIEVARLSGGATGVRADSQVVWITPRPPSEHIPPGARVVRVTVRRFGRLTQGPNTVTSARAVHRAVALLNALPLSQPGTSACPIDLGSRVRLAFSRRAGAAPVAVAVVDPGGCGLVRLTIGRTREPALAGGAALAPRLGRVLGVKIDTGVR
jgi:hypothetical protein